MSFTWGVTNVIHIIRQSEVLNFHVPDDNYDWSFGQVVSVLLLIAPVVSLLESFSESKRIFNFIVCPFAKRHDSNVLL